ncbi:MAG: hypothetical protein IT480_18720 [Gammaproteobacteria bacterium]|nr:hypothetical protein [Gammaproteobacteria bacterium]
MNRLSTADRARIVACLVEGNTRLTNAFSKKAENLAHAVSLHFMYYNFARKHQTLKTTPAIEAGVADHIWSLEEIAGLLDKPRIL